jgi:molybdopterin/thiamine biosynthesis adenylyltransferase
VQERLAESRVLILGIGGIGTNTALGLAMLGIGNFMLVDFDVVELQNLNRQALFDATVVGRSKTEVAVERLIAINSDLNYEPRTMRIRSAQDIIRVIAEFRPDITVLGADRPFLAIDRWTSAASWQSGVPYITGTVNGGYGAVWARIPGRTCCEECVLLWVRDNNPDDYEIALQRQRADILPLTSALGVGAQIVGGLIGYDVYHYLIGQPVRSAGVRRHIDFDLLTIEDRPQLNHPECGCGSVRLTADG